LGVCKVYNIAMKKKKERKKERMIPVIPCDVM
jgi:hypothetical protein